MVSPTTKVLQSVISKRHLVLVNSVICCC